MSTAKARKDGKYLLVIGCVLFVFLSLFVAQLSTSTMDFRTAYYSSRCLIEHCDPYNPTDVLRVLREHGGEYPTDTDRDRLIVTRNVYLPTEFTITAPFAIFPHGASRLLWVGLMVGVLLLASVLMWEAGADYAPLLSGGLIGFYMANCEILIYTGNPAALAVGLCVIAVWCFLRDRFIPLGILCLAASLALKPQDAGFVWLFFLLTGGNHRRRALQTAAVLVVFCTPAVLWVIHLSPHWIQELHANMAAFFQHGGINDPGPASGGGLGVEMVTDLQAIVSTLWDDARIYNTVSYAVCLPLLLLWMAITLKMKFTVAKAWIALSAVSALTMLPVYHREYDAKLLLLAVPGCALLWATGGKLGKIAMLITSAVIFLTADGPWIAFLTPFLKWNESLNAAGGRFVRPLLVFPLPLILLAVAMFYLWVYWRARNDSGPLLDGSSAIH